MNAHFDLENVSTLLERIIRGALEPLFTGAGYAEIRLVWTGSALVIERGVEYPSTAHTGPTESPSEPSDCRAKIRRALRIAGVELAPDA